MFYGVILLLISGVGAVVRRIHPLESALAALYGGPVHVAVAMATIGGFIIHVYMGTAMVRGGFTSIIRGEVTATWAKTHHRLWYDQVTGRTPAEKKSSL